MVRRPLSSEEATKSLPRSATTAVYHETWGDLLGQTRKIEMRGSACLAIVITRRNESIVLSGNVRIFRALFIINPEGRRGSEGWKTYSAKLKR